MKTLSTFTAIGIAALLASHPAKADQRLKTQEAKSGATFLSGAILGGIAAGPIGFIAGAAGGAFLAEQGKKSVENAIELEKTHMTLNLLQSEAVLKDHELAKLEKAIQQKIQFQLYFETGTDTLNDEDAEHIHALSDFLLENKYLHVKIDGHADPRGSDEYNNILSQERANAVATLLIEDGVAPARIQAKGHGVQLSQGLTGDSEDYARQRKVRVEVSAKAGVETGLALVN